MELDQSSFWFLETNKKNYIYKEKNKAVKKLQGMAEEVGKKELVEGSKIFKVTTEGDQWNLEQVPWSEIAMEMMGIGGEE